MGKKRPTLRLSEDAVAGLDALTAAHHCSRNALFEALGLIGRDDPSVVPTVVVDLAHRLDRERYSRR